jgi:deoxycytidylate deaminase
MRINRLWIRLDSGMTVVSVSRKDIQYMQLCLAASQIFSTCGKRQYSAVLVDELGHVVGMGYNGGPSGFTHCKDGGCPRLLENSPNGSSYENCFAIHAEANAFLHSDYSSKPAKLYVNGPPCFSCAKLICNSTIKDVFYLADENYLDWPKIQVFFNSKNIQCWDLTKWLHQN